MFTINKKQSSGKYFSVLPLLFLACSLMGQGLTFPRESICFRLDRQHFSVSGYYYFAGAAGLFPVLYPFPNGSGVVDSATVTDSKELRPLPYTMQDNGLVFGLNRPTADTSVIQIYYREKVTGGKATYILTTTRAWGRALEWASYSLLVAPGIKVTSLSLKPDSEMDTPLGRLYFFKRADFMPAGDFVVEYER